MTDNEMRDLFREMREEPVPADSLARVRARVAERAARRRWWRLPAIAAFAAGCGLAVFFALRPAKPVERPSIVARVEPAPPVITPAQIPPRPKRERPKQVASVPVSMIRIETPDPEVVILLVN